MDYEIYSYYDESGVKHYGVVGMKWGVRRGNYSKAFTKASNKANKIEKKRVKIDAKAANKQYKASKKLAAGRYEKGFKQQKKAAKLMKKSAKLQKKGAKWANKMEKVFSEVKVSDITPEALERGKRYAYMLAK